MEKYLLLRNNQETGPHSIEQLGSIGLLQHDLIWVEGESTSWKYPEEIDELKSLIRYGGEQKTILRSNRNEKIFISLPPNFHRRQQGEFAGEYFSLPVNESEPVLETNYVKPLEELKENYRMAHQKKPIWGKKIFRSSNVASIAAVFIGVVLGALIIKKMVDGYVPEPTEEVATATPIIDHEVEKLPDENMKNALVTEIVPVYKTTPLKKVKKTDLRKQLKLSTNNYKVGLFGGINGLQLTVFNTSSQIVDKVIVALDYLRPNGAVVQSENIAFSSIKPRGAQTISIPGSNRGVKVRYKILKVLAHDYKTDLKEI